jgi:hypothetical protein
MVCLSAGVLVSIPVMLLMWAIPSTGAGGAFESQVSLLRGLGLQVLTLCLSADHDWPQSAHAAAVALRFRAAVHGIQAQCKPSVYPAF